MKKIILTLTLALFAITANAQLIISANIGGGTTSGDMSTNYKVVQGSPAEGSSADYTVPVPLDKTTSLVGGLKIGYKFGRAQMGIAGSFYSNSLTTSELDATCLPILESSYYATKGEMTVKTPSFKAGAYFRYDIIEAGDVSLFAELNIYYAQSMDPTISAQAKYYSTTPLVQWEYDTAATFRRPDKTTTLGVSVTPGMSWQLSKHCGIDLYFDVLSLAYTSTTRIKDDYTFILTPLSGDKFEAGIGQTTTTTTHTTEFGGMFTGTPLLTNLNEHNWVRVGFNFTF